MWPSPPMPTIPTRLVGLVYMISGLNTVMPPHKSGPASATSIFSGSGIAQAQLQRTRLANAPLCPTMVKVDCGHKWWSPDMHWRQCMQLPANQPIPTCWPIFRPLVAGPNSTTRPVASCPNTAGNFENPQSLFRTEMSEWHRPQCSTLTSTSSAPSGPRSTCCRTNFAFAVGATHASIIAIAVLQKGERLWRQLAPYLVHRSPLPRCRENAPSACKTLLFDFRKCSADPHLLH